MIGVVLSILVSANAFDDTFDRAVDAYSQGDYGVSVRLFEQLVAEEVVEPDIFYNLGNAYYRSGRLAPAIANYERALQLDPGLEPAQENLQRSIIQTRRGMLKPRPSDLEQNLLFWHYGLRGETSFVVAVTCWLLFWMLLAVRRVKPMPYLRRSALLLGLGAILFGISWWAKTTPQQIAVATVNRVPVRYGTNDSETVRFELFVGDRVAVDKRQDGWARVETADGERGWTQENFLVFVGPPYAPPSLSIPEIPAPELSPSAKEDGALEQGLSEEER